MKFADLEPSVWQGQNFDRITYQMRRLFGTLRERNGIKTTAKEGHSIISSRWKRLKDVREEFVDMSCLSTWTDGSQTFKSVNVNITLQVREAIREHGIENARPHRP